VREQLPTIVDRVGLAGRHDVVVDRANLWRGVAVFDRRRGRAHGTDEAQHVIGVLRDLLVHVEDHERHDHWMIASASAKVGAGLDSGAAHAGPVPGISTERLSLRATPMSPHGDARARGSGNQRRRLVF
jgi:hypothetical protein